MKRLNQEKKRAIAGTVAIILVVVMILSIIAPFFSQMGYAATISENPNITIKANIGFDSNIKLYSKTPFEVIIENNSKENFKGSIRIPIKSEMSDYSSYNTTETKYNIISQDIELPAQSSKIVNFEVNVKAIQSFFDIDFVNEKGKVIKTQRINAIASNRYETLWYGILSDNPDKLNYFKFFSSDKEIKSFNFNNDNFSNDFLVLGNFQLIVIDSFNIKLLSQEQKNALKCWVENGGILISSEEFTEVFDENDLIYVNKEFIDSTDKEIYNNINTFRFGKGFVFQNDFSLVYENISNSVSFTSEINYIFKLIDSAISINSNEINSNMDNLNYYVGRLPSFMDNKIKFIFIVLFIYAFSIYPFLYVILKKKGKREYAIKVIPITSIIITVLIYFLSFDTAYKKPIASIVSYVDLNSPSIARSCFNIMSSKKGDIKIDFTDDIYIQNLSANDSNYNYFQSDSEKIKYNFEIKQNDNISITKFNNEKWSSNYINTTTNTKNINKLDMDLKVKDNQIFGTIINNTGINFENIVLGIGNNYIKKDTFIMGEKIELGKDDLNIFFDADSSQNFDAILTNGRRNYNNNKTNEEYFLELRQDIVNDICYNNTTNNLKFNFIGFNKDSLFNNSIKVNNQDLITNLNNVFYQSQTISYNDFIDGEVPFGVIKPKLEDNSKAEINNDTIYTYYNYNTEENFLQIKFQIPDNITIDDILEYEIYWNANGFDFQLYNFETKSWEDKSLYNNIVINDFNDRYINKENEIIIQATNIITDEIDVPQIRLKLKADDKG